MPDPSSPDTSRRQLLQGAGIAATAAAAGAVIPSGASAQPEAATQMRVYSPRPKNRVGAPKGSPTNPELGLIALNRMGFGPRPGDLAAFNALGGTPEQRLQTYVDQQLNPTGSDPEVATRFSQAGFTTLNKSRTQLWADHHVNNTMGGSFRNRPRDETIRATWIRAIYSQWQLREVLADFWHNHFNVYAADFWVAPMFVHYDRDVIRGNIFGNFRQMIEDVAKSTAMLYYLDNYTSSNAGPNENFCRELFELHCMGAENYLGVRQQNSVPVVDGRPIGYVDADVFEATRCFTGWTVSNSSSNMSVGNTGDFHYRAEWHDRFQKNVLGVFIPQDQAPLQDGDDVLDALASHPGTGRHIARKLCRRLISDDPPESIVIAAAAVFTAQWQAPDQLRQVVRTILLSDEFRDTWGEKVKRPFEIVAGAMRAGGADFTPKLDDGDTGDFLWYVRNTGQELFYWPAPNGFPDVRGAWQSTTPRGMTWRLCAWLIEFDDDNDNYYLDVVAQTPPGTRSANGMVDFWVNRILNRAMDPADRQALVDFLAQGFNPDLALPVDSDDDTADRLRSMVALIFMSPDFLWR